MTEAEAKRIEDKLDMIISFFNIGKTPTRSKKELDNIAEKFIIDFESKLKKKGQKNGNPSN